MNRRLSPPLALAAALVLALVCELLAFNWKALFTLGRSWEPLTLTETRDRLDTEGTLTLTFEGLDKPVETGHILIWVRDPEGKTAETSFTLWTRDQGRAGADYMAGSLSYTPAHDKGSYFRFHSYGDVKLLRVVLTAPRGSTYTLVAAEVNGSIPFRISMPRVLGLFALFCLLWALRPGSVLHDNRFWNRRAGAKVLCLALVLALNLTALGLLSGYNEAYVHPPWEHHEQYARLARALAEGQTWIDGEEDETGLALLAELENPYDNSLRKAAFQATGETPPWDIAYYDGHLYVYFGVVPVLLTYLPWYLLTGADLPNVWVVLFSFALVVLGAFALVRALIRRHFPETPFTIWVLLSLLLGNCTCVFSYVLAPSFYVLPITFSLAFVYLALALWTSAAERWSLALAPDRPLPDREALCFVPLRSPGGGVAIPGRIALGALLAALVAGCRPQFLVFSALALPIFLPLARREADRRRTWLRVLWMLLPYGAVAAGVLYYNGVRFGSPLDFGANYNLTTNSMTLRGWHWDRLPDGFWDYLFRLPRLELRFPYVHEAATAPLYIGLTIREKVYGGVLVLCPFLWSLLGWRRARSTLRREGLWGLTLLSLALAVPVLAADTEMAGILWRYVGDFLPLLSLAAALVFLARYRRGGQRVRGRLTSFLVFCLFATLAVFFLISFQEGSLLTRDPDRYYRLRDLLDLA